MKKISRHLEEIRHPMALCLVGVFLLAASACWVSGIADQDLLVSEDGSEPSQSVLGESLAASSTNSADDSSPAIKSTEAITALSQTDASALETRSALEVINTLESSDPVVQLAAWDAGFAKVSELDPQRVLRWRPVLVDAANIFS